jgi:hypothetical protein
MVVVGREEDEGEYLTRHGMEKRLFVCIKTKARWRDWMTALLW